MDSIARGDPDNSRMYRYGAHSVYPDISDRPGATDPPVFLQPQVAEAEWWTCLVEICARDKMESA